MTDRMIVMRRLPADRRLSQLAGTPGFEDQLRSVARTVAAFHAAQAPVFDHEAALAARWATTGPTTLLSPMRWSEPECPPRTSTGSRSWPGDTWPAEVR